MLDAFLSLVKEASDLQSDYVSSKQYQVKHQIKKREQKARCQENRAVIITTRGYNIVFIT